MTAVTWRDLAPVDGAVETGEWPLAVGRPGLGFLEGPVWVDDDLLVVGVDSGTLLRVSPDGAVTVEAVTGGGPNGAVADRDGTVYVAQSGGAAPGSRRWPEVTGGVQVVRDGTVHYLTRDPVAPNDLCFGPDGQLYVTDPTRGRRPSRDARLWRCDPATGETVLLTSVPWHANGIAFGADRAVYVADTFGRRLVRFEPRSDGWLGDAETFAAWDRGIPDGFALDTRGRFVVVAVGEEGDPADLVIVDPDGQVVERVALDSSQECTNVAIAPDGRIAVADATRGRVLVGRWTAGGRPTQAPARMGWSPDAS